MTIVLFVFFIAFFFSLGMIIASPTALDAIQHFGRARRTRFVYAFSALALLVAFLMITGYGAVLSTFDSSCTMLLNPATGTVSQSCVSPSLWSAWLANLQPQMNAMYLLWLGLAGFSGLGAWTMTMRNLRDVRKAHFVAA